MLQVTQSGADQSRPRVLSRNGTLPTQYPPKPPPPPTDIRHHPTSPFIPQHAISPQATALRPPPPLDTRGYHRLLHSTVIALTTATPSYLRMARSSSRYPLHLHSASRPNPRTQPSAPPYPEGNKAYKTRVAPWTGKTLEKFSPRKCSASHNTARPYQSSTTSSHT